MFSSLSKSDIPYKQIAFQVKENLYNIEANSGAL